MCSFGSVWSNGNKELHTHIYTCMYISLYVCIFETFSSKTTLTKDSEYFMLERLTEVAYIDA